MGSLRFRLTENAKDILRERYLIKDATGAPGESIEQLFDRVARCVSSVESKGKRAYWRQKFGDLLITGRFLPNSPTLMNAGLAGGQLSACFVLPIEDSLESVFTALKNAALIHQSGGGTGFSFSKLRMKNSRVRSTAGVSTGPVGFIELFDAATELVKQGGVRRGANMAVLRVDHPDIELFIESKREDGATFRNFNISVGVTDSFLRAVHLDANWELIDPHSHKVVREVSARGLFMQIARAAWACGDPGLIFLDRIELFNPTPRLGRLESTNPCGEQPLLDFESCNLGSIDVSKYFHRGRFDWEQLESDLRVAVRFLDNVIDANTYPLPEIAVATRKTRKIGLGIMGFADLLLLMQIPYSSSEARMIGERLMGFVDRIAKTESARLAVERGAFPAYRHSIWKRLGYPELRNATLTTVAPTGTISLIAGCSSGIEPVFSSVITRRILEGRVFEEIHPELLQHRIFRPLTDSEMRAQVNPAWETAHELSVEAHIQMQAVFQRFSDSAVSKTINLPNLSTPADVSRAYLLAYELGCKGITVFRDGSKQGQVISSKIECVSC